MRSDVFLVGAGLMHRWMNKQARGPTPGVCYVEEKSHLKLSLVFATVNKVTGVKCRQQGKTH